MAEPESDPPILEPVTPESCMGMAYLVVAHAASLLEKNDFDVDRTPSLEDAQS